MFFIIISLYFWNKCIYLKKLCWIKFHVRLSSKALRYCPTVPPATPNPRVLKQLGEKADEVYLGHTVLTPTAPHHGDPGPQQAARLKEVWGSLSEKTPTKPLGRSETPPLAVFLVIILSSTSGKVWHHWQQDVTAGSKADSSCSADSHFQCGQDYEKMERATPTEQVRHVCQTLCQRQLIQTLNNPT